jgi:hypothetical protein
MADDIFKVAYTDINNANTVLEDLRKVCKFAENEGNAEITELESVKLDTLDGTDAVCATYRRFHVHPAPVKVGQAVFFFLTENQTLDQLKHEKAGMGLNFLFLSQLTVDGSDLNIAVFRPQ